MRTLEALGADVHGKDTTGGFSQHAAVRWGHTIKSLVKLGADVNGQASAGNTAFHLAAQNGLGEMLVRLLMELSADVHAREKDGAGHCTLLLNLGKWRR